MAKYVCDYGAVVSAGQSLIQAASELTSATNNYSSKITSDLSTWSGEAKSAFMSQCESQVAATLQKAQTISEFGEFIVKAAQSIQELDDQLASLSI